MWVGVEVEDSLQQSSLFFHKVVRGMELRCQIWQQAPSLQGEMAEPVKELAAKFDGLSSIPEIYRVERKKC